MFELPSFNWHIEGQCQMSDVTRAGAAHTRPLLSSSRHLIRMLGLDLYKMCWIISGWVKVSVIIICVVRGARAASSLCDLWTSSHAPDRLQIIIGRFFSQHSTKKYRRLLWFAFKSLFLLLARSLKNINILNLKQKVYPLSLKNMEKVEMSHLGN